MQGVGTDLDELHAGSVREIWQLLRDDCGLSVVKASPKPHFTWQIAEEYDLEAAKSVLQEIILQIPPFRVFTTGLGLFTGQYPVLYIPVIKNAAVVAFHEMLWERLSPFRRGTNDYYSPLLWTPHITLAYEGLDPERMICALERLSPMSFNWELLVDNLSIAYQPPDGGEWVQFRYDFQTTV
jgi:2'-5' RNA ligase